MNRPEANSAETDVKPNVLDDIWIVKIGTDILLPESTSDSSIEPGIDHQTVNQIGRQIIHLCDEGHNATIVTSGFVSAGMEASRESKRPKDITELQRLASLGAMYVMSAWSRALAGREIGQVLVTRNELSLDPDRNDALGTVHSLMQHHQLPVLNNNDAVSHSELEHTAFTQNDELSATLAAQIASSELFGSNIKLIILSNVDGVLADYPDPESRIPEIGNIDDFLHLTRATGQSNGTGGMRGKLESVKIAQQAGVPVWIANGREGDVIEKAVAGEVGTYIKPAGS